MPEQAQASSASSQGKRVRTVITVGIIGTFLFALFAISNGASNATVVNGVITAEFAAADPCSTTSFALAVPEDVSAEEAAEELFQALRYLEGISSATVHVAEQRVEVAFCESAASESSILETLAATGLVAQ